MNRPACCGERQEALDDIVFENEIDVTDWAATWVESLGLSRCPNLLSTSTFTMRSTDVVDMLEAPSCRFCIVPGLVQRLTAMQ